MNEIDSMIGQPVGDDVFDDLCRDDARLKSSLEMHIRNVLAPEERKQLRTFSVSETAALLGLTVTNLRRLHNEDKIPDVAQDKRGYRNYSASSILEIRKALAKNSRNPLKYLPRRQESDGLQILTISTFKGGSSKSTTAIHAAQRLALKGYRVLAIDMDPQGSLSSMLGLSLDLGLGQESSIYQAIKYDDPVPMREVIRKTYFEGLDVAPAALILSEFETETPIQMRTSDIPFYLRLSKAIEQVENDYDIVVIDCPPQLGYLTMNALVAATGLLITIIPNMLDVASLSQYLTMTTSVLRVVAENGLKLKFDFQRYLLCRYEPSDQPQANMGSFLRVNFGNRLMTEPFLKSTAVSDAGLRQMTLYEINRNEISKPTLDRAVDSINRVVDELEISIKKAWGRD